MVSLLCRNRVHHRKLDLAMNQFRANDRSSVALSMSGARISDDLSLSEYALRFDCNQFRVAGTDTDSEETSVLCAFAHSSSLASALTAAAAMALPPRRPRTVRKGSPSRLTARAALDSAAPTNPTGMPIISAGRGAPPSTMQSRWKSAVEAFPITTTQQPS